MADNRELSVWDVFASTSCLKVIEGEEELATRFFENLQLDENYGTEVIKKSTLYAREKKLLYGCGLVTGKLSRSSWKSPRHIAAPLYFFEAIVKKTGGRFKLSIDFESGQLNLALLESLASVNDLEFEAPRIPAGPLLAKYLLAAMDAALPEASKEIGLDLINFPNLESKSSLEDKYKQEALSATPAAMLFLANRSTQTRGVIHELDILKSKSSQAASTPLRLLLNSEKRKLPPAQGNCNPDRVPGILSLPQRRILKAAACEPLSLVIGPPGTGKSFTIASIAIERFIAGESVLIAAQNDQAIQVLAHKVESELGISGVVMRGGEASQLREMKEKIEGWLHGYGLDSGEQTHSSKLEAELERHGQDLKRCRTLYAKRSRKLLAWGALYAKSDSRQRPWWFRLTDGFRKREILKEDAQLAKLLTKVERLEEERERLVSRLARLVWQERLREAVEHKREQLSTFLKSLRSRSSGKQEELLESLDFVDLLSVFPVWLTTLQSLHKILPSTHQLFDLVLIDEATQCDMASALPALQRAKRACVVGDPKQLRHVSFLSNAKENELAAESGLPDDALGDLRFRTSSLLDLVDSISLPYEAVNLLDEHFRSRPELIEFSNRKFYQNSLKIMKEVSSSPRNCLPLTFEYIDGAKRDDSGVNKREANALIKQLEDLINAESKLEPFLKTSIGILSPFRSQVSYLARQIERRFDVLTITSHRILVGSPYSFQGEERDCMLLSLALDKDSHPQALRHAARADVFNVSITRAKNRQIVFHSLKPEDLGSPSLLSEYLDSTKGQSTTSFAPSHFFRKDYFLEEVTRSLEKEGYLCEADKQVAGLQVDLLCSSPNSGKVVALNLVGYPGAYAAAHQLDSFLVFKRAGLEMLPVSYPLWKIDPEAALRHILERLRSMT